GGRRLARREQDRGIDQGVQQQLRAAGDGPRRGRRHHLRRLGHRRPRDPGPGDGAAVPGGAPDRVGEPAHAELRVPSAGRRDGGGLALLRRGGERAYPACPGRPDGRPGASRRTPEPGPQLGAAPGWALGAGPGRAAGRWAWPGSWALGLAGRWAWLGAGRWAWPGSWALGLAGQLGAGPGRAAGRWA